MHDTSMLILAIVGSVLTWTGSIIALVIWLTTKFRDLEKLVYREGDKHRREDAVQFKLHGTKIQRLELKAFGFTGPTQIDEPTND